jgi:hypothetical protein
MLRCLQNIRLWGKYKAIFSYIIVFGYIPGPTDPVRPRTPTVPEVPVTEVPVTPVVPSEPTVPVHEPTPVVVPV